METCVNNKDDMFDTEAKMLQTLASDCDFDYFYKKVIYILENSVNYKEMRQLGRTAPQIHIACELSVGFPRRD